MKRIFILLAVFSLLAGTAAVFAEGDHAGHHEQGNRQKGEAVHTGEHGTHHVHRGELEGAHQVG